MRKSNEQTIKSVISDMLEKYRLTSKINEVQLVNSWEKIMGKLIAKNTTRLYVKEGKLHISVTSPALKEELSYNKPRIVELVNLEFGSEYIKDVVIW